MQGSSVNRRGSALLIVLGFLSFMVVSAVAFSVFMRSERVPSSALRSGVTTRHLVHTALANAISRVDVAIGSDPFPGVTGDSSIYTVSQFGAGNLMYDSWAGRVFMPPNPEADETKKSDGDSQNMDAKTHSYYALPEETVPVLNLEALGYVPPCLINDVRYQSRRSWAAKWEPLDYDAGRYAFCAVNVSDFIDINRVWANTNRSSACRVSLAHLFNSPSTFDSFARYDSTHPFVSMMDYNLYFGTGTRDALTSSFCKWIKNGNYDMADTDSADTKGARNQFFVTDSWFPRESTEKVMYLDDANESSKHCGQPFKQSILKNCADASIVQVVQGSSTPFFNNLMKNKLARTDYLSLFDYLDRDDLPLSVALPCCERVPMVAGISPVGFNVTLNPSSTPPPAGGGTTTYSITPTIVGGIAVSIAFPFKRLSKLDQNFKVSALARVFMAEVGLNSLRIGNDLQALRPDATEWTGSTPYILKRSGVNGLVWTGVAAAKTVSAPSSVEKGEANVIVSVPLTFSFNAGGSTAIFEKNQIAPTPPATTPTTTYTETIKPFMVSGTLSPTPAASPTPSAVSFQPYVAIWVKIEHPDGGVVDLVPALMADDDNYGGPNNSSVATTWESNSKDAPLLLFSPASSATPFTYANLMANNIPPVAFDSNNSYLAFDPRFNWMPEDFLYSDSMPATPDNWWKLVKGELGSDGRDPDPFMFVSNQGYLQSMGELAFIPRGSDGFNGSDLISDKSRTGGDGVKRTAVKDLANFANMFRTYRAYETGGLASDNLFFRGAADSEWKILDSSGGFKINPYSDIVGIRLLPFTNTPYDWWVAGTNTVKVDGVNSKDISTKQKIIKNLDESLKYAFNGDSNDSAKLTDQQKNERAGKAPAESNDDRVKIANAILGAIRGNAGKAWEEIYDGLAWDSDDVNPENLGSFRKFLGTDLNGSTDPLHSVDRKFLYAYWRGCFANRQQLFLIFVRAESTALGGSEGRTASQLGGRAVALVWRDPSAPSGTAEFTKDTSWKGENRKPHRTRILFYHQLD